MSSIFGIGGNRADDSGRLSLRERHQRNMENMRNGMNRIFGRAEAAAGETRIARAEDTDESTRSEPRVSVRPDDSPVRPQYPFVPNRISLHYQTSIGFTEENDEFHRGTVLREQGMLPSYVVGFEAEGEGSLGDLGYSPITLKWSLGFNYENTMDYNEMFTTDYRYSLTSEHLDIDGSIGYSGVSLFGLYEPQEGNLSVLDDRFLSYANPSIENLVRTDLRVSVPLSEGRYYPHFGYEAWGGDINVLGTEDGSHFIGEWVYLGGGTIDISGWRFFGEYGYGTRSEEVVAFSDGTGSSGLSDISQALEDSTSSRIDLLRLALDTPQYGPASYHLDGYYRHIGKNGITDLEQWGLFAAADFGRWDVGFGFDQNPVPWIGNNNAYYLSATAAVNPALELTNDPLVSTPMRIGPTLKYITFDNGESAVMFTLDIEGYVDILGRTDLLNASGPITVPSRRGPRP